MMIRHALMPRQYLVLISSTTLSSRSLLCSRHGRLHFSSLSSEQWLQTQHTARTEMWGCWQRQHLHPVQWRHFHTTPQRFVSPVFWVVFKPFAKLGAILSGRMVRKWWQGLPTKRRRYFWGRLKQRWYYVVLVTAALSGAGVLYYKYHVEKTPLTGRERFIAVTHEQFMKIALAEAGSHLLKYEGEILPAHDPSWERVVRVFRQLLNSNPEISHLMNGTKWRCYIIDEPSTINAFVLPTGHVFIFSGILDFAQNDDQLAIILAHEMAHAVLNHGIEQVSYAQLTDVFIITTMAAIWCILPNDGISIVTHWFYEKFIKLMLTMPYSRMMEKEADKVGLQMAAKACYDVREGSVFWARMDLRDDLRGEDEKVPEWLSTHPSHGKRVEFLDFLVPKALEMREEAKCPRLPTKDPRETIKALSAMVDSHKAAKKSGQNLSQIQVHLPSGSKKAS